MPTTQMPFGKYQGADLEDIPTSYLRWLATEATLKDWLYDAVRAVLLGRKQWLPAWDQWRADKQLEAEHIREAETRAEEAREAERQAEAARQQARREAYEAQREAERARRAEKRREKDQQRRQEIQSAYDRGYSDGMHDAESPVNTFRHDMLREVVEAGYRALAKKIHPDIGGSTEEMRRLNQFMETFRRSA